MRKDDISNKIIALYTSIEMDSDKYNVNDQLRILKEINEYVKSSTTIDEIKKHYDLDPYLYYVILKDGYRELFGFDVGETFLTQSKQDGEVFHDMNVGENSKYKNSFTIDEIDEIKKKYGVDLEIYHIIKVLDYIEGKR